MAHRHEIAEKVVEFVAYLDGGRDHGIATAADAADAASRNPLSRKEIELRRRQIIASRPQQQEVGKRQQQKGTGMASGKVLWFNPVMGHGYIQPSDGRTDVPIDRLAVELAGQKTLKPGQKVRYEVLRGLNGKPRATALRLID